MPCMASCKRPGTWAVTDLASRIMLLNMQTTGLNQNLNQTIAQANQLLASGQINSAASVTNISGGVLTVGNNAVQTISADAAVDHQDRITTDGKGADGALHLGGGAAKVDVKVDGRLYVQGRQEDVAKTLTRTERAVNVGRSEEHTSELQSH